MGFRDQLLFNKAMLGKRGWRLTTRPDSLCAKVLKGCYFHDDDFPSCTRKQRASHTWRAIMAGKEVLDRGMIKRIGNGVSTHIWRDRWIPLHFDAKPITPEEGQDLTLLIRDVFLPIDVEQRYCEYQSVHRMMTGGHGSQRNMENTLSNLPTVNSWSWHERNRRRHGEGELPIRAAIQWCVDTALDLWQICKPSRQTDSRRPMPTWSSPQEGWLKCNVDGAFYPGQGEGATGGVLRDGLGAFVGGRAIWYRHGH
ncbi:unnamed protein product [Miscanthus lutarioriparius]|uniref:RNase H type-1 domain-containing protein n=1 Tax=Miscanthus lutarioriparius TaxID=422564 RepID=A0A811R2Z1_9POAL|nr:unnamed protein product [Miscanthus lutarioriparius]